MKFGVFSVSMPEYDIKETAKLLKELGYDAVEWRIAGACPAEKPEKYTYNTRYWCYNKSTVDVNRVVELAPEVKAACEEAGIEVCSLTTYLSSDKLEQIENVMKACNIIGCKSMRCTIPGFKEAENYNDQLANQIELAKPVQELAKKYGVRVHYEMHMRTLIPSASAAYRFISNFDPKYMGILYDPGNLVYEGFENYKMGIDLLGDYLSHVHVKNAVWAAGEWLPDMVNKKYEREDGSKIFSPENAPLKEGYGDMKRLLDILQQKNYEGYVCLEDFNNNDDTYTKLKRNIAYLKSLV